MSFFVNIVINLILVELSSVERLHIFIIYKSWNEWITLCGGPYQCHGFEVLLTRPSATSNILGSVPVIFETINFEKMITVSLFPSSEHFESCSVFCSVNLLLLRIGILVYYKLPSGHLERPGYTQDLNCYFSTRSVGSKNNTGRFSACISSALNEISQTRSVCCFSASL